jgi:capsular exopolysaccharide synthesis family protein
VKNNKTTSIIELEDFTSILRIALKNWYIPLVSILLSFFIAYIYSYRLTNVFAAQTQVLVEPKGEGALNEQNIISENFGAYNWWNKSNVDNATEMRIIQSYDLTKTALLRMKLDVSYFIVGRIKTTEVYQGMPFLVEVLNVNPQYYEQFIGFKILSPQKFQLRFTKNGEEVVKEGYFNTEFIDSDFKLKISNISINKERLVSFKNIDYNFQIHDIPNLVYSFQNALTVENPEGTNILQLKLEDAIPERALAFLDTLTNVYIENSLKTRLFVNSNTLKYIEKQMSEVVEVLNGIEDTMQRYKENKAILNLDKEQEDYFSKMSEYDATRSKQSIKIGALNSLESYIIEGKDPQFLPPAVYIGADDPFLEKSATELYTLQIELNERMNSNTLSNYGIKELQQRIDKLKNNLLIYIANSRTALKENLANIEKQIAYYVTNIKSIPQKQRDLINIERNFEVNQKMYVFLLEKRSNTIVSRAGILPEKKVIETARSIGIVRPDKQKIMISFIAVGFLLSLIIIFIRTSFYSKIESIEELKAKTSLPVLGEILFSPTVADWAIAVEKETKSPITESFRTIRTNLQFMAPGQSSKIVVVTSNNPGEGKTFTSLNIAAILAKAGKKVLILELDLHKPKVQKALNMVADVGISSVVIGKTSIEESIKPTTIENLSVMLSGPTPPNPSEMILSQKLLDILHFGKANFDFVIIDTPPVGLISDALVLMKHADLKLFVLNTKYATREAVANAIEIVEMNHLTHFGFILNGVKRKRSKYYYNKYSYGYGYGYGEGYGNNSVNNKNS